MNSVGISKAMIAVMLASLMLIFGGYLSVFSASAQAAKDKAVGAMDKVAEDVKPDELKDKEVAKVDEVDEEGLMKLALEMKAMGEELDKLMKNEANLDRLFDPQVTKDLIDREMLEKLEKMHEAMLEDFDKINKEAAKEADEPVEVDEPDEVEAVEDEVKVDEPDEVEAVEAEELKDEDLLKVAMGLKLMEMEMEKFLESDSGTWEEFFRPAINPAFRVGFNPVFDRPFIDREFLFHQLLISRLLLGAFDERAVGVRAFPRPFFAGEEFDD